MSYLKNSPLSIAIIDVIGLVYDGTTLTHRGLGGSESAVILLSQELAKLGFSVTVFNNCIDNTSKPGVYNNVTYRDLTELDQNNTLNYDIVISSRTVIPFLNPALWEHFLDLKPQRFKHIKDHAKLRIVWMHDTFCRGDHLLEDMLTHGDIHEIFTLSDFHSTYISNCDHGKKRMYEIIKRYVFQTRNGIIKYHNDVDVAAKDPYLYVYNASVTKGMLPLVNDVWPAVKAAIPQAKLKVIGGYYRFRENAEPDAQEKTWRELVNDTKYANLDIEFTGILPQSTIADILAKASYMLYPAIFPETFGISTLESLAYNTPLITTRFGALEETAVEQACYLVDYPVEPNSLFPNINRNERIQKFIETAIRAGQDRYLHQQKQYYCNIVKDICTWDTIALQWKQHLYKKLGYYLPVDEYRTVAAINQRVHQVFGRRTLNVAEENYLVRNTQQRIVVITPMFNAEPWIDKCIESVITQDYDNYHMYIIDDCSTDDSCYLASQYLSDKITVIHNQSNVGAVKNQLDIIRKYCTDTDIVMLLDGDDSLVNDNQLFHFYNNLYHQGTEFSYGSCWSLVDNIPLIAQHYPAKVKQAKTYRQHRFNWNMPYTHLRTFRAGLIMHADDNLFKDSNGNYYKAGGDGSIFYAAIEAADPDKVTVVTDIVYNYNDASPINDYKINGAEQTQNAERILKNLPMKKKILIAIPTARNIEAKTFKSIYDLIIPDGYECEFQFFYGYQIDQVRNLIAHWAVNYDYLFSVDSDIAFAPDTLAKLLAHDVPLVSGLYIQRKPGEHILELYKNGRNIPYATIQGQGLVEIDGCGFGCVLVKSEVLRAVGYPQFVYKSAIDHKNTVSEDTYFCIQAKNKGYRLWADTSILCEHIGTSSFIVDSVPNGSAPKLTPAEARLFEIANEHHIDDRFKSYIRKLDIQPTVIYDIGANVLDWAREVKAVWPNSEIIAFEAMEEVRKLFDQRGVKYHLGVLSDADGRAVRFYQNSMFPWGNSYFKENENYSPPGCEFNESHAVQKYTRSLDSVVKERNFPWPDLIKLDVQGAELDVLKGGTECLKHCSDLFIELQHKEYNKGAPNKDQIIEFLSNQGFELVSNIFLKECDGDYHFKKKVIPTKVYIIKNNNSISQEYAQTAAESCNAVGYKWEYINGFENITVDQFRKLFPKWKISDMDPRALCASLSHYRLWELIADRKECAIILEHDALMLHPINISIPDNTIVALGYKFSNPNIYNHVQAGPPTAIHTIPRHSGAHAYAITWKTAEKLLEELEQVGIQRAIDNYYFMRINQAGDTESSVPLAIADPTPAIGWLRKSTIWQESSTLNYDIIDSFRQNSKL